MKKEVRNSVFVLFLFVFIFSLLVFSVSVFALGTWDTNLPIGSADCCSCGFSATGWDVNTEKTVTNTFYLKESSDIVFRYSIDNDIECSISNEKYPNRKVFLPLFQHEGCAKTKTKPLQYYHLILGEYTNAGQNTLQCRIIDRGAMSYFDAVLNKPFKFKEPLEECDSCEKNLHDERVDVCTKDILPLRGRLLLNNEDKEMCLLYGGQIVHLYSVCTKDPVTGECKVDDTNYCYKQYIGDYDESDQLRDMYMEMYAKAELERTIPFLLSMGMMTGTINMKITPVYDSYYKTYSPAQQESARLMAEQAVIDYTKWKGAAARQRNFERLLELKERANIYIDKARNAFAAGDSAKAEIEYKKALRIYEALKKQNIPPELKRYYLNGADPDQIVDYVGKKLLEIQKKFKAAPCVTTESLEKSTSGGRSDIRPGGSPEGVPTGNVQPPTPTNTRFKAHPPLPPGGEGLRGDWRTRAMNKGYDPDNLATVAKDLGGFPPKHRTVVVDRVTLKEVYIGVAHNGEGPVVGNLPRYPRPK